MKISIPSLEQGFFPDRYGKRGTQLGKNDMPTFSIPVEISEAPAGTQSFVLILDDKDAVTAAGFVWNHWLVANLKRTSLPENDSQSASDYVQGANSWASVLGGLSPEEAACYGGMAPPNGMHRYDLTVYALDCELDLKKGFLFNELHYAMQGHVLASACVSGRYDA